MQLLCPSCRTPLSPTHAPSVSCPACDLEVDLSRQDTVAGKPRFLPERSFEGQTINGFVIGHRIGAGGMGTVYQAQRVGDAQAVRAFKFLSPWFAGDPQLLARFGREIEVMQAVKHPRIVPVLDHGTFEGIPWFAMPFIAGKTLRDRMDAGPLPFPEAQSLFHGLLQALAFAHDRGVIHRDLKPSNVLLSPAGPLLADFGIAQLSANASNPHTMLTASAAIMGTLPYMSPEQRQGATLDGRSDLFSCGVMMYEALSGQLPQGAFPPPSRIAPRLPRTVDAFVMRLLQPTPAARFTNADAALGALSRIRTSTAKRTALTLSAAGLAAAAGLWAVLPTEGPAAQPPTPVVVAPAPTPPAAHALPSPPVADEGAENSLKKSKVRERQKFLPKAKSAPIPLDLAPK